MTTDHLDLLPPARHRALKRMYLLRFGTVAAYIALVLVAAAAALLVPTYLYLRSAEESRAARLASVSSTLSTTEEAALAKRLTSLDADATAIAALGSAPSAATTLTEVLAVPHPGIVLTGFAYAVGTAAHPGTVAVSGAAATRNDLRAYQLALAANPRFASADLPVSSYAKDSEIPFTITATLATSTMP